MKSVLDDVHKAARRLDSAQMIRYSEDTGDFVPTNLGRTASYFYINVDTMEQFNHLIMPNMTEAEVLRLICKASEFEQIQVIFIEIFNIMFRQFVEFICFNKILLSKNPFNFKKSYFKLNSFYMILLRVCFLIT